MIDFAVPEQDSHCGPTSRGIQRNGLLPEAALVSLRDVLVLIGGEPDAWSATCAVRVWRVRAAAVLQHEQDALQAIHVVRSGSFKCCTLSEDGYEQVLGFAGAGDVVGFEGLALNHHPHTVMALEDSSVYCLPVPGLEAWRRESPALDQALLRALSGQLASAREIAGMMAALAADVRMARFLVWLSARMAARGQPSRRLTLHMSRREIASMLGVAHETVSRSLGMLSDRGILKVRNRDIDIIDLDALKRSTRCVRRDPDAPALREESSSGRHTAPFRHPTSSRIASYPG